MQLVPVRYALFLQQRRGSIQGAGAGRRRNSRRDAGATSAPRRSQARVTYVFWPLRGTPRNASEELFLVLNRGCRHEGVDYFFHLRAAGAFYQDDVAFPDFLLQLGDELLFVFERLRLDA
jgi:hypothetical protein